MRLTWPAMLLLPALAGAKEVGRAGEVLERGAAYAAERMKGAGAPTGTA